MIPREIDGILELYFVPELVEIYFKKRVWKNYTEECSVYKIKKTLQMSNNERIIWERLAERYTKLLRNGLNVNI